MKASKVVDLKGIFPYFNAKKRLDDLNDIVDLHSRLEPRTVMTATGCSFNQALQILILLFELKLVEGFFLIYLKDDPVSHIGRRSFKQGFPDIPFVYQGGDKQVNNANELVYSFEFARKESIEFVNHYE